MTYQTLLIEDADGVRTLTLNRPETLNALNDQMKDDLAEALKAAERDRSVRCVVITGAGRAFSSGQDIKELQAASGMSIGQALRDRYTPIIVRIRTMEKPVIAAVNGVAAGAGCSLALACDLRTASDKASFIQAFVRIGLVPDCGATFLLPRLVGLSKALEMAMTGDALNAETAHSLGLVSRLVPESELKAVTHDLARRLAQGPTKAIGLTKRAMNRALATDLSNALDYEAYIQEIAARTQDYLEGLRAFADKRAPVFHGE